MKSDSIATIGIDEQERIYVSPRSQTFPFIYREAVEVNWNSDKNCLYSPKPREWSYFNWFQHIIGAAALQSCTLNLTAETAWINISSNLRSEIEKWMVSRSGS